ncbi:MAG: DUF1838 family protein [Candidatus Cloacimonetes bacterium]|nr:DUF1838 family protein [Candidatus Cloacimonadota bacterium]
MRSQAICCLLLLVPALICGAEAAGLVTHINPRFTYKLDHPADWQVKELADSGWFEASSQLDKASLPCTFRVEVDSLAEPVGDFADYLREGVEGLAAELLGAAPELDPDAVRIISSQEIKLGKHRAQRIDYSYPLYGALNLRAIRVRIPHFKTEYLLSCEAEEIWYFDQVAEDFEAMVSSFRIGHPNQDHLDNYIRTRADLSGGECVFHWQGKAYSYIPGERRKDLFSVEGYNIVRALPDERGYLLLGKEVMLFLHNQSGEILQSWFNPISGRDVPVIHVFNDPANMDLRFSGEQFDLLHLVLPSTQLDGQIAWHHDLFPLYPNPLSRQDFPLFSQSDLYQAADISQYLVKQSDLEDPLQQSVPALYSFTRIYPWLPFMRMGERPGNLIMVGRGRKLEGGFGDLPQYLRDYVLAQNPEFSRAPDAYSQPNQTIWTNFQALAAEGLIEAEEQ